MDPHLKTPYSEQGNIGIQRQLTSDIALNVSYIWSRGVQLYGVRDLNLPSTDRRPFTYTILDANGNADRHLHHAGLYRRTRPDTRYGGIYHDENGVNSYYNALAVQVSKRFATACRRLLSYTWSHEIDDGQSYGESTNNLFLNSANYWLYNGNYKADKGSGTLDQRHRGVLSWVWAPTFTHRTDVLSKCAGQRLAALLHHQHGERPSLRQRHHLRQGHAGSRNVLELQPDGFGLQRPRAVPAVQQLLSARVLPRDDARSARSCPSAKRSRPTLNFEVFNVPNTWSARGFTSSQAYTETGGKLTPTPASLYVPSSDAFARTAREARRMQIALRISF